ncbi:hypothetical protein FSARC_11607 [Fusarium sarcochroum]|uniref:Transcription factor domain-containing protein n=1 Tax=Fusarium sarcochroum TaxID=1208366 RepID=A0A8H4X0D3_9HYPO|nr:hypothetical protein FSARC_11607 [Fusarium sarcochroum]
MPVTKQSAASRRKFAQPPAKLACVLCRRGLKQHQKSSPAAGIAAEPLSQNVDLSLSTSVNPQSRDVNSQQQPELLNMDFPQPGPVDEMPGFLPTLYNDNLNEFHFEDIFYGDSNEALDNFFVDVFSLPSYPQVLTPQLHPQISGQAQEPQLSCCTYRSDAEVLQAYYQHIHPTFPILPPPLNANLNETAQRLPDGGISIEYRPSSPLILALLSILVLAKPPSKDSEEQASLSASACSFAQLAIESLRLSADGQSSVETSDGPSFVHPILPSEVETPLALCVLSQYQYLHCGNIVEMTELAERAFDLCISLSLQKIDQDDSVYSEARKRAWWMTPPTRVLNMAEVTTPFPTSRLNSQAWSRFIQAEETLLAATLLLVALVKGFSSGAFSPGFRRDLTLLDKMITCQLEDLQEADLNNTDVSEISDGRFHACFTAVTRARLLGARIKLHRYRALMGHPGILKKFESLPTDTSGRFFNADAPESASETDKLAQLFPFTSQYSLQVCFDSTMQLAACLDYLGTFDTEVSGTIRLLCGFGRVYIHDDTLFPQFNTRWHLVSPDR